MPTLNEEEALEKLALEVPEGFDVLVVDSFSEDNSRQAALDAGFIFIQAGYGRGQGSGVKTGMEYFLEKGYSLFFLADADYTDVLADLVKVRRKLLEGDFNVVLGVRDQGRQRKILGHTTMLVKKTVSFLLNKLTGLRLTDVLTGVWGLERKSVEEILPELHAVGFEYGFEIVYTGWKKNLVFGEVDVGFRPRLGDTKLTLAKRLGQVGQGVKYGFKALYYRLRNP